ncbi:hypothetical protein [Flavobacterium sp.]|uniref:hypothetical protein n=1 Tax=Flavobacterium sp. TaxID=239 RepID=UPI00352703F7
MSTNSHDQEIDLGQIFSKIGSFFQSILDFFFDIILFVKKNIIVIVILLVVGVLLGLYVDKIDKEYDNQIIVTPNFGSVDYLYSKVSLLDAKKKEKDTMFFKNLGFKNIKDLGKIEIKPIMDVFKFVENNKGNFELIELMAEDGDIEKIIEGDVTSKNYPLHEIKFSTSSTTTNSKTVEPLLNFLNNSEYYEAIKKQYLENETIQMRANDSIITQINSLIDGFAKSTASGAKTDKMVYISDNNQLNEIITTKNNLVDAQGKLKINLINNDKIIKDISVSINKLNTKGINGKRKFVYPIALLALFVMLKFFKIFYSKQMAKRNRE